MDKEHRSRAADSCCRCLPCVFPPKSRRGKAGEEKLSPHASTRQTVAPFLSSVPYAIRDIKHCENGALGMGQYQGPDLLVCRFSSAHRVRVGMDLAAKPRLKSCRRLMLSNTDIRGCSRRLADGIGSDKEQGI